MFGSLLFLKGKAINGSPVSEAKKDIANWLDKAEIL
jgi:hypothetical protein